MTDNGAESHLDELFAAPLDRFVEVRGDIVRRLKAEGAHSEAAAMAAQRKPGLSVWVVNQLARTAAEDLAALTGAGERLEAVQRAAMTGGATGGYAEARAQEAEALARLDKAVRRLLPSITAQVRDRILTTLRSGAASTEGRAMLAAGRLTHDLEPSGFDLFSAGFQPQPPQPPQPAKASKAEEAARRRLEALRSKTQLAHERAVVAVSDAQRASDEAEMAERRARRARTEATSAARRAETARSDAARLAELLTQAEADPDAPKGG